MAELAPLDMVGDYRLGYAGDTFNTAWYLRQLNPDQDVSYLSAVGCDAISADMLRFMAEAGIGTDHIARCPGHSVGLYMISLIDGERSFSYWRDTSAARLLARDETAMIAAIDAADLVYFSGITLAILSEVARERLLRVLQDARAAGRTIAFDPNLRPGLWPDPKEMQTAIMQGASVSDIVLPSFEDEAMHFGDPDPQGTIARYAAAGATVVIVKNGADPVLALYDGATLRVDVPKVGRVVDTTSAGDSFNAGFLTGWGETLPMAARVRRASAVAGQVVGGKGALVTLDDAALAAARALSPVLT